MIYLIFQNISTTILVADCLKIIENISSIRLQHCSPWPWYEFGFCFDWVRVSSWETLLQLGSSFNNYNPHLIPVKAILGCEQALTGTRYPTLPEFNFPTRILPGNYFKISGFRVLFSVQVTRTLPEVKKPYPSQPGCESRFSNQNRLSTLIIIIYEPYESNLWVTFEDQPAKTGGCLIAQDFLNPLKTTFESLCSQHLLKHLKKNKSRLHLDGSHLRSQPWEHHHLRCHQLRPGMGGDLHEYLPYNLSNPKSKQPLWFISLQCVC